MLKNDIFLLVKLIFICMILFFFFDVASVLLSTFLVFFKTNVFLCDWENIFSSFFSTGYVGGIILGTGLWVKAKLQERKNKKEADK